MNTTSCRQNPLEEHLYQNETQIQWTLICNIWKFRLQADESDSNDCLSLNVESKTELMCHSKWATVSTIIKVSILIVLHISSFYKWIKLIVNGIIQLLTHKLLYTQCIFQSRRQIRSHVAKSRTNECHIFAPISLPSI